MFQLDLLLELKGLNDILFTGVSPTPFETDNAYSNWIKKGKESRILIRLNAEKNIALKILTWKTAEAMIDRLETLHGKKRQK